MKDLHTDSHRFNGCLPLSLPSSDLSLSAPIFHIQPPYLFSAMPLQPAFAVFTCFCSYSLPLWVSFPHQDLYWQMQVEGVWHHRFEDRLIATMPSDGNSWQEFMFGVGVWASGSSVSGLCKATEKMWHQEAWALTQQLSPCGQHNTGLTHCLSNQVEGWEGWSEACGSLDQAQTQFTVAVHELNLLKFL